MYDDSGSLPIISSSVREEDDERGSNGEEENDATVCCIGLTISLPLLELAKSPRAGAASLNNGGFNKNEGRGPQ